MEKHNHNATRSLHRLLCLLVLIFSGVLAATATGSWYYYKTTATSSPTGGGKVYVATEATYSPSYKDNSHSIADRWYGYNSASLTFFFYAQENENYIFSHWAENSATGNIVSYSPSFNKELTFNSDNKNKPTQFNYYAVFTPQTGLIKVRSENISKGTVHIDNPNNVVDDVVTLTANPDASNGVMFLGWKKNNTGGDGEYFSTDNPLVLTASSQTAGTYWAYFSDAAEKVYIRLKNKKTGRFLSFYGNVTATAHNRDFDGKSAQDGFVFTNSLKMIPATDAQGNPSTVFLRTGHAMGSGSTTGVDLVAHNVQYSDLVDANITTNKYMLTIENRNGNYRIYTPFSFDDQGQTLTINSYLCDEGTDFAVMKTEITGNEADWTLYSLEETTTEGALGANTKAKFTKDGKYYTTMYADFPYKLLDGVKAYYLTVPEDGIDELEAEFENHGNIVFLPVESDIIPANMAVILECAQVQNDISETESVCNRLLPLMEDAAGTGQIVNEGANFLKGYVAVNGSKVDNDIKRMYVLSYKNGKLGFFHSTSKTMTPNKAYLLAPEMDDNERENLAKNVTFSFGFPDYIDAEPTKINFSNLMEDAASGPVFDLLGRRMSDGDTDALPKGIYIRNGKKFVVK